MRLILQRVSEASVSVNSQIIGQINEGIFVLVGFKKGDTKAQVETLASKLLKIRIMADENGKMNLVANNFLVVSQFTLYANTKDGNRPSFIEAEKPVGAENLYKYFIRLLSENDVNIQTGKFGEYMGINAVLDGPVTITLES
mgnify:CR=1 FL=1